MQHALIVIDNPDPDLKIRARKTKQGADSKTAILQYGSPSDDTVEQIKLLGYALEAARLGARPPIISALTGVKETIARKLYRDATGKTPPRGQLPGDPTFFVYNSQRHLESLWLLQTYRGISTPGESKHGEIDCALLSYRLYEEKFSERLISFDRFFFLIRMAVYGKHIAVEQCSRCDGPYLFLSSKAYSGDMLCPVCTLPCQASNKNK